MTYGNMLVQLMQVSNLLEEVICQLSFFRKEVDTPQYIKQFAVVRSGSGNLPAVILCARLEIF